MNGRSLDEVQKEWGRVQKQFRAAASIQAHAKLKAAKEKADQEREAQELQKRLRQEQQEQQRKLAQEGLTDVAVRCRTAATVKDYARQLAVEEAEEDRRLQQAHQLQLTHEQLESLRTRVVSSAAVEEYARQLRAEELEDERRRVLAKAQLSSLQHNVQTGAGLQDYARQLLEEESRRLPVRSVEFMLDLFDQLDPEEFGMIPTVDLEARLTDLVETESSVAWLRDRVKNEIMVERSDFERELGWWLAHDPLAGLRERVSAAAGVKGYASKLAAERVEEDLLAERRAKAAAQRDARIAKHQAQRVALVEAVSEAGEARAARVEDERAASRPVQIFGGEVGPESRMVEVAKKALEALSTEDVVVTDGLWRIPGAKAEVSQLIEMANQSGDLAWDQIGSPHNMVGLMVQLLMQLPGGLIDGALMNLLIEHQKQGVATADSLLSMLKENLSPGKLELMVALLDHWTKVVAHEPQNRMSSSALSTCVFAALAPDMGTYMQHINTAMQMVALLLTATPKALDRLRALRGPSKLEARVQQPVAEVGEILELLPGAKFRADERVLDVGAIFNLTEVKTLKKLQKKKSHHAEFAVFEKACVDVQASLEVVMTVEDVEARVVESCFEFMDRDNSGVIPITTLRQAFPALRGVFGLRSDSVVADILPLCAKVEPEMIPEQLSLEEFSVVYNDVIALEPYALEAVLPVNKKTFFVKAQAEKLNTNIEQQSD